MTTLAPPITRLAPLDSWRGLIIVVMALDHANGFITKAKLEPEMWAGPYPDYGGDWAAFLTRWVTHLAAPGFFFLLGVGAVLFAKARAANRWTSLRITTHLALRGALLITLQFLWENPAWNLGQPKPDWTYIGVLFALGGCLMLAAPLVRLRVRWLVSAAVVLIAATELILPDTGWTNYPVARLMVLWPGPGEGWFSLYPILPWMAVTLLGMAFAHCLGGSKPILDRAGAIGAPAIAAFVVIRAIDGFGNIRPAQTGDVIGFLNTVKYPPALTFLLPALGIGLVATAWFQRDQRSRLIAEHLAVFGRAPLFFYLTHLYLYAQLGVWVSPTSRVTMLAWWVAGLVVLYPACLWFARLKRSRPLGSPVRFL